MAVEIGQETTRLTDVTDEDVNKLRQIVAKQYLLANTALGAPVVTGIWQSPEAQALQQIEQDRYVAEHKGERREPVQYGLEAPDIRNI